MTDRGSSVAEFAAQFVNRIRAFARYIVVRRQLAAIARAIDGLNLADRRALIAHTTRELEISLRQSREASTTNAAFIRARADNPRVRLVGMGQWLTSAFRESEQSSYGEMQELHRQVMRMIRILRESAIPYSRVA
jgi:hypothetical protein